MRGRIGWAYLALGLWLLLPAWSLAEAPGEQECAECHGDLVAQFNGSPHGRAYAYDPDQAGAGCTSCHGNGTAHVQSGGDVTQITVPGRAADGGSNAACLSCHENRTAQAWWRGSAHETAGLSCTECHAIHGDKHTASDSGYAGTTEKCLSCHEWHGTRCN